MASGPDLFVVCKHCGAEVSPYITECPYCGNRIQKRAPKLDRDQRIAQKPPRKPAATRLPRLRRGEIPGIRHEAHPYATLVLTLAAFVGTLLWRTGAVNFFELAAYSPGAGHGSWFAADGWHVVTAAFTYDNTGYAVITVGIIAIFGVLLEHRHGPVVPLLVFLLGGLGGTALALSLSHGIIVDGAGGAAIAMLVAWAVPDLLALAAGEDFEGDLIGVAVLGVVVALMPLVTSGEAAWASDVAGVVAGLLIGYPLARLHPV